jgi:murein DD-endopeptidase MepM/ murein hydrolase activator NlpD
MKHFLLYISLLASLIHSGCSCQSRNEVSHELDTLKQEVLVEYDIVVNDFQVIKDEIAPGDNLSALLFKYGIGHALIDQIVKESKKVYDLTKIIAGRPYTVFMSNDSVPRAKCFIYEPNNYQFIVVDLRDSIRIYKGEKEVEMRVRSASGTIHGSLWETMQRNKLSPALVMELSQILAWTIDFFRIQKNDHFKVIFEEKFIEGNFVGIGRILAVEFGHSGKDYYAFRFEDKGEFIDYYDLKGNNMKRAFLKSPVEFARISSKYTQKRFHPVQKIWKPHLGTDYAAPQGTPIMSTANGTVVEKGYTNGNGNYVKVKHNETYSTQYLHMSRFAAGLHKGQRVRQGEVIGYVGSTGLATGPHVCYRFWVNGKQVDPFKQNLPTSEPINKTYLAAFETQRDSLLTVLKEIPIEK